MIPFEKVDHLFEELTNCTLLEIADLLKKFENIFGNFNELKEPNVPIKETENPILDDQEKPLFNLIITGLPSDKKITILKVVRTITGLGLKESKAIVDNVPQVVKDNLLHDEALKFKKELENAGAEIKIEPIKQKN